MVVFCAHFEGQIQNFSEMKRMAFRALRDLFAATKPNAPAIPQHRTRGDD
jgi:hypothetical protein